MICHLPLVRTTMQYLVDLITTKLFALLPHFLMTHISAVIHMQMAVFLSRHLPNLSHCYFPSQQPYNVIFFIQPAHFNLTSCVALLWLINMSKKVFLWYCSIDWLDISWNTLSLPTISWNQHRVQGSMQLIPDLLLTFISIYFVRFDLVLHRNFLNSTCMIFECVNARSRPHSLDISPLVITRQHLAWPLRTKL